MRKIKLIALIAFAVIMTGCSGLAPYKNCVDCTQFPLVYQGTITQYTQGVYLETACLTIDLSKFTGFENFEIGEVIYIEYVIKQGEFCSKDDESIYRVYTVSTDKDLHLTTELIGNRAGIKLK